MGEFTVERRSAVPLDEFVRKYRRPGVPVVLSDAAIDWEAHKTWSFEFLRETLGDRAVTIDGENHNFGEFLDRVLTSSDTDPAPYLRECDITTVFPELMADIAPALMYAQPNWMTHSLVHRAFFTTSGMSSGCPELLIGGTGGHFPTLHFDTLYVHAFITQIQGDKEFTVFPPDQARYLYPKPDRHNQSQVNVEAPDLDRFPQYRNATPHRFVVGPGETVFMPSGWWHVTRLLTPSIAVSFNSVSEENWPNFRSDAHRRLTETRRQPLLGAAMKHYMAAISPLVKRSSGRRA